MRFWEKRGSVNTSIDGIPLVAPTRLVPLFLALILLTCVDLEGFGSRILVTFRDGTTAAGELLLVKRDFLSP